MKYEPPQTYLYSLLWTIAMKNYLGGALGTLGVFMLF